MKNGGKCEIEAVWCNIIIHEVPQPIAPFAVKLLMFLPLDSALDLQRILKLSPARKDGSFGHTYASFAYTGSCCTWRIACVCITKDRVVFFTLGRWVKTAFWSFQVTCPYLFGSKLSLTRNLISIRRIDSKFLQQWYLRYESRQPKNVIPYLLVWYLSGHVGLLGIGLHSKWDNRIYLCMHILIYTNVC